MNYKENVSSSMTTEDVKLYIQKVVREVRKEGDGA
jgi:hypothetical protein